MKLEYHTRPRRYSRRPFPPYRHLPGRTPHPVRHPQGHLFGREESVPHFRITRWWECDDYLYGVDLYNHGYYWEAHEAWEGIWKSTGRTDLPGRFLQGLIQLAAALLKRRLNAPAGTFRLARKALAKLETVAAAQPTCCGLSLLPLVAQVGRLSKDVGSPAPVLAIRSTVMRK